MTSGRSDDVQLHFKEIIDETAKAYKFRMDDDEEIWIAKSQCQVYSNSQMVSITRWLAEKLELV